MFALLDNTTGADNTACGTYALMDNTTGSSNTAHGYHCLRNNETGGGNTAVGRQCLDHNTTGDNNTAVGYLALDANTTGIRNTAVGRDALTACTTGGENTAIGRNAGNTTTTGANITCIGHTAQASSATANNEVTIGNANVGSVRCGPGAVTGLSDGRDKTDVVDLPDGLDFVNTLRPVKFKWQTREGLPNKDGKIRAGFIAQDLQKATEGKEYLDLVYSENPDKLEVTKANLLPILVNAIKELSAKVTALEAG